MYDKICKSCGWRLSQFYNSGMLGCPECYKAFQREIEVALRDIQGSTIHVGKTPNVSGSDKELLSEYTRLLNEKEKAGLDGRFSDMAKIGRQIEELIKVLKERGLI